MKEWLSSSIVKTLVTTTLLLVGWSARAANTITISNPGTTVSNYPVQIGRAFAQGEISSGVLPQASITGIGSVSTQVDVKNRWPDGSLKFAILSFLIPTFPASQTYTVTFSAGTAASNAPQTLAQMLATGAGAYNFDAQETYTVSTTSKTVSARAMLQAMQTAGVTVPACETVNWTTSTLAAPINACYWTQGPIATTVIIANHDTNQACNGKTGGQYDLGFDSYCSIRPLFEATFWPSGLNGAKQVKIRFEGEIGNTQQQEDVALTSLTLYTGSSTLGNQTQVYTRNTVTMRAGSRWTLRGSWDSLTTPTTFTEFWMGGSPVAANLNHNVSYLASTTVLPNYDATKSPSASTINTAWNNWLNAAAVQGCSSNGGLDIYQYGELSCGSMTGVGGHAFIGPMPSWTVRWLYSGDNRMAIESLGNTELMGAVPIHFREGNSTKNIVTNGVDNYGGSTINGLGRIVSTSSRPTFSYNSNQAGGGGSAGFVFGTTSDGFTAVGNFGTVIWDDPAHMPQLYVEYLLSGDFYYLEESEFWSAYATWFYHSGTSGSGSRGPTGAEGTIPYDISAYQTRGMGWANLSRLNTWLILPDAAPEKTFFDLMNKDALTAWEAEHNITTGYGYTANRPLWNWANTNAFTLTNTRDRFWSLVENGGAYLGMPPSNMNWFIPDFGSSGPNGGANCYGGSGSQDYPNLINYSGFNGIVSGCQKNFMVDFILMSIGRSQEIGYNSGALEAWVAVNILAQVGPAVNSSYPCTSFNPWLVGAFVTPQYTTNNTWYQSWTDVCSNFQPNIATATSAVPIDSAQGAGDPSDPNGYYQQFEAAASYAVAQSGGQTSWNWIATNLQPAISQDLKWAIVPRSINQTTSTGTAANLVLVSGNNQTGTTGQALATPFTVEVTDSSGSPVSGIAVSFAITSGGGTLSASSVSSNSQGLASSTLTLGTNAATNTVVASSATLSGSPITFTASGTASTGVTGGSQSGITWTKLPITAGVPSPNDWFAIPYDPVSGQTVVYATGGAGIYSSDLFFYQSKTNTWTQGPGTRSKQDACPADTPIQPGDRHPAGQMAIDTKRNFLWLFSGVDAVCGQATVTTNGTAVTWVTGGFSGWVFPTGGQLNNQTVYINGGYYTIASVQDSTHLTLTTSAGVQSTAVKFQVMTGTETNPRADLYFLRLTANPAQDTWQQVTFNTFPKANTFGSLVYDPDDDVLFLFGYDVGANTHDNWVYCRTAENPTPGVLTGLQSAAGCTAPDDWSEVTVVGGVVPPGSSFPGLIYDPVTKQVIQFGGASSSFVNQTWAYSVPKRTWTQKALSTVAPPVDSAVYWAMPALAYNSATGKVLYHQTGGTGAPADWQYDPAADTWTLVSNGGGAISAGCNACAQVLAYDATQNVLVGFNRAAAGGPEVWVGTLSGGTIVSPPPPSPQPPPTANACDLNTDGVVNMLDIQLATSQVLGTMPCSNAALDGTGTCTVVDLQRVINASLGSSCRVGP